MKMKHDIPGKLKQKKKMQLPPSSTGSILDLNKFKKVSTFTHNKQEIHQVSNDIPSIRRRSELRVC